MLEIDLRKNRKKFRMIQGLRDVNRKIEYQCHGV